MFAEIRVGNTKGGISCSTAKKSYLQGMQGWSKSERIYYQTSILTHAISWSLLKFMWVIQKGIVVKISMHIAEKILPARNAKMK